MVTRACCRGFDVSLEYRYNFKLESDYMISSTKLFNKFPTLVPEVNGVLYAIPAVVPSIVES
jgi:hypothetical protein